MQKPRFMYQFRQTIGYDIDKDELIKALQYDRNQYQKGYADALKNKKELLNLICVFKENIVMNTYMR